MTWRMFGYDKETKQPIEKFVNAKDMDEAFFKSQMLYGSTSYFVGAQRV